MNPRQQLYALRLRLAMAEPAALLKSRRHCHLHGLSSIVLAEEQGCLCRMFLAGPESPLHDNTLAKGLTLGVHNHRYALKFLGLYGTVVDNRYRRATDDEPGIDVFAWRVRSRLTEGLPPLLEPQEPTRLCHTGGRALEGKQWRTCAQTALHTIKLGPGAAAWLVVEGPVEQEVTELYTTEPQLVTVPGLYAPFASVEDVISHVDEWIQARERELDALEATKALS